jgi:hypothetical protein
MTVPTELRRCTGHYVLDGNAANYAGGALIDHSGRGHDFPLVTGTPIWTTRDSVACADFDNLYYFERRQIIPLMGSIVAKIHFDPNSLDGALDIVTTRVTSFGNIDDHAALTVTGLWEDYDKRIFGIAGGSMDAFIGDRIPSGAGVSIDVAFNAWHVVTGVWNLATKQAKLRIGAGTVVEDASTTTAPQWIDDVIRLGYLRATSGITAGKHCSVAEIAFFHDDILLNQASLAAGLVASWT